MKDKIFGQVRIFYFITGISAFLFLANDISGQLPLIQHLDASIEGSIVTDGSDAVTEWIDQTTFSNNATISAGTVYRVQDGSLSWLDFGGGRNMLELFNSAESDEWLDQSSGSGGFCVILSFKMISLHTEWNDLIGNSSAVSSGFGLRYSSSGSIRSYLGGTVVTGSNIEAGDAVILAFNYSAASGLFKLWDSKSKSTVSGNISKGDFSQASAVTLGSTTNNSRYFIGYVGEVKIYNNVLSEEDFQNETMNLFQKWVSADMEKDPPTPDPATFSVEPAGISGSLITMTATTGYDINGPVEYLFTETTGNPGGTGSGWQTNPNFRDADLDPLIQYAYTVTMRDAYGNAGKTSDPVSAATLAYSQPGQENELEYGAFYGYQGWHFAEGDGRIHSNDWVHWFENNIADADHIHGDMWPDLREYDPNNLYETQMKYPNAKTAKVYSSHDYSTIDLHVKWMKEYGIKGCVVQRFTSSIDQLNKLEQGDKKIRDIMTACENYGLKFWIMHDSGQGDENEYERITKDWKHLVDDLDVLQSPAYTWQNGLPVYGLWGLGVNTRQWTAAGAAEILDFYQKGEDNYRTYVVAGVPVIWRTDPPPGWNVVFDRVDMISPWRTIFNDPDKYKARMQADFNYCNDKGIDYNPVVSPGASTKHLRDSDDMRNWKPRNGGYFLWEQVYEVCKMGSRFMYVAMFDEVDEGTAMYKMVETTDGLPLGADQVPLNEDGYDLPSDWYLQVGTEIQKMLEGSINLTPDLPISPDLVEPGTNLEEELEINSSNSLKVYPLPANMQLFIKGVKTKSRYQVIDLLGKRHLEGELLNNSLDISGLSEGLYILNIDEVSIRFIKTGKNINCRPGSSKEL